MFRFFVNGTEKYNLVYIKATSKCITLFEHESLLKEGFVTSVKVIELPNFACVGRTLTHTIILMFCTMFIYRLLLQKEVNLLVLFIIYVVP